jgi:Glycosyltransferase family 87
MGLEDRSKPKHASGPERTWAKILGESALLLVLLAAAPLFVQTSARQMWDFETYWYAARSAISGGNPYSSDQLALVADRPVAMPFVYPPSTVPLFLPFTVAPVLQARWIWLALKVLAILALFQLWRRRILPTVPLVPLAFAAAFGFNAAAIWDLKTGNVSGLEQLVLWLGFSAHIQGRPLASAMRIAVASIFKLLPAAFLALLVMPVRGSQKENWKPITVALSLLAAFVVVPILVGPEWARGYLGNFPDERPWGYVNPSALGLIDTLLGRHGGSLLGESFPNLALSAVYVLLVGIISVRPLRRAMQSKDALLWVMTAIPLFVLLVPRPMIYTYLLAVPAMFYLLTPMLQRVGGAYAVGGILGAQAFVIPGLGLNYENPWTSNLPFFLLLGLWTLYAVRAPLADVREAEIRPRETAQSRQVTVQGAVPSMSHWLSVAVALSACAGIAWFLFAELKVAGRLGYSLDDSWIYATFARNVAGGHGYSFNPGQVTGGATGPLYVGILAALYALFGAVVLPAKILGGLCLVGSSLLVYRSVRRIDPRDWVKPLVAGLLVALSPSLLWGTLSGMEIPVYLLVACLGVHAYVSGRWTMAVLWWSLGVWLRPDGLFLVLVGLLGRPKAALRNLIPVAVAATIVGAWLLFNQIVGGHLLPNSVAVKAHPWTNVPEALLGATRHWAGLWGMPFGPNRVGEHAIFLLPAVAVGAALCFRRFPALPLYVLGAPIAFAIAGVPWSAHGRYIMYVVPFGMILGVMGLEYVCRRVFRRRWATGLLAAGLVCLSWQVYESRVKGILHGWNVQNIENMHRFFAERIATATSPGDTIAVNDVGAMGYFSKCYVVDLVGLVSPQRSFQENLAYFHPKFLAVFPDWYAGYGVRDPQIDNIVFFAPDSTYKYTPVAGVGLTRNTIASLDQMILFQRIGLHETGPAEVSVYWR